MKRKPPYGFKVISSYNYICVSVLCLLSLNICLTTRRRQKSSIPPLKKVFGKNYKHETRVEQNFYIPLVYMASVIMPNDLVPEKLLQIARSKLPIIFLYTQGTERESYGTSEHYKMNVTSCMIGEKEYPVFFNSTGVYGCHVTETIKKNERITLVVSTTIYELKPKPLIDRIARTELEKNRLGDGRYLFPSTVKWDGQIEDESEKVEEKYEICAMTQELLFPELIDPWVSYHRRIGVDKFFIYDNGCEMDLVRKYKNREDIEILHWPWPKSQLQAQNHFLVHARTRCHWVILFDVDEYIALRYSGTWAKSMKPKPAMLRSYLRYAKLNGFSQIVMKPIDMGSSGILKQPNDPPPESFIHRIPPKTRTPPKTIAYSMHVLPDSHVHTINSFVGYRFLKTTLSLEKSSQLPSIGIVHYKVRSWEEYYRKAKGPRNSIFMNRWNSESLKIENVPKSFLKVRRNLMFSKFRLMWREVMKLDVPDQVIVAKDEHKYDVFIGHNTPSGITGIMNGER